MTNIIYTPMKQPDMMIDNRDFLQLMSSSHPTSSKFRFVAITIITLFILIIPTVLGTSSFPSSIHQCPFLYFLQPAVAFHANCASKSFQITIFNYTHIHFFFFCDSIFLISLFPNLLETLISWCYIILVKVYEVLRKMA